MQQDDVAGKILLELTSLGIATEDNEWILYNYLSQAYAAGWVSGREARACHHPVAQYDLKGEMLNIYDSVAAAVRATGLNKSNIANCARGRKGCLTAGGFRWQYITMKSPIASEQTIGQLKSESNRPK